MSQGVWTTGLHWHEPNVKVMLKCMYWTQRIFMIQIFQFENDQTWTWVSSEAKSSSGQNKEGKTHSSKCNTYVQCGIKAHPSTESQKGKEKGSPSKSSIFIKSSEPPHTGKWSRDSTSFSGKKGEQALQQMHKTCLSVYEGCHNRIQPKCLTHTVAP